MGRSGIRPRKPRQRHNKAHSHGRHEWPGVIEDLEDQAAWSSYTQDIPRLGNPYRERMRWARAIRFFSGLRRLGKKPRLRTSDWWLAFVFACLLAAACLGTVAGLVFAVWAFFK